MQKLVFASQLVLLVHPGPTVNPYRSTSAGRSDDVQLWYRRVQFVMHEYDHELEFTEKWDATAGGRSPFNWLYPTLGNQQKSMEIGGSRGRMVFSRGRMVYC